MSEASYHRFSIVFEKLSHALRTPLGVNRGVVQDLLSGLELDTRDYQDALDANTAILGVLQFLKQISSPVDTDSERTCNLRDLITGIPGSKLISVDEEINLFLPKDKVAQVLLCFFEYLFEIFSPETDNAEYKISSGDDDRSLKIEISSELELPYPFDAEFLNNVEADSRLASIAFSLGTLLCENLSFEKIDDSRCVLVLVF